MFRLCLDDDSQSTPIWDLQEKFLSSHKQNHTTCFKQMASNTENELVWTCEAEMIQELIIVRIATIPKAGETRRKEDPKGLVLRAPRRH